MSRQDAGAGAAEVEVLIGLGSNLGDRHGNLEGAVAALRATPGLVVEQVSPWIETEPVGGPPGQGPYLNGALVARTRLRPGELLARLQEIEAAFGRRRDGTRDAPRTLDLDLLAHGQLVLDGPELVLPHPRLEERTFVLEPLARLVPERVLPRSGKTVRARLEELRRAAPAPPR